MNYKGALGATFVLMAVSIVLLEAYIVHVDTITFNSRNVMALVYIISFCVPGTLLIVGTLLTYDAVCDTKLHLIQNLSYFDPVLLLVRDKTGSISAVYAYKDENNKYSVPIEGAIIGWVRLPKQVANQLLR